MSQAPVTLTRRQLLVAAAAWLPVVPAARAQPAGRRARVGYVATGTETSSAATIAALRSELQALGWTEGRNVDLDVRFAQGDSVRAVAQTEELLGSRADVVVVTSTPAAVAARAASRGTPVVFSMVSDPVASGIVASLARPGGNLTGWSNMLPETSQKLLELLREVVPRASRAAVVFDPSNAGKQLELTVLQAGARRSGLALRPLPIRQPADLKPAFASMERDRPDGIVVLVDGVTLTHRGEIAQLAAAARIPAVYEAAEFVVAGGLMSYGMNMEGQFRRSAHYVDRILRGARPADLPVEQPTMFELVVNQSTARELGLKLPQPLLLRADRVLP